MQSKGVEGIHLQKYGEIAAQFVTRRTVNLQTLPYSHPALTKESWGVTELQRQLHRYLEDEVMIGSPGTLSISV